MAWDYEKSAWNSTDSGTLPGPALSISAASDDSVFVSGVSATEASSAFIWHFDGSTWSQVAAPASETTALSTSGSTIKQLALVPLTSEQPSSALFSSGDRGLLVSGQLSLNNFGQASSAIFDGSSWYPYLLSATLSGSAGTANSIFYPAKAIAFGRNRKYSVSPAA